MVICSSVAVTASRLLVVGRPSFGWVLDSKWPSILVAVFVGTALRRGCGRGRVRTGEDEVAVASVHDCAPLSTAPSRSLFGPQLVVLVVPDAAEIGASANSGVVNGAAAREGGIT